MQGVLSLANVMMTANSSGLTSFSSCFYLCSFLFFRCHPAKKGSKNSLHTYVFNSGIFSWLTEKFTAWNRNGGTHIPNELFHKIGVLYSFILYNHANIDNKNDDIQKTFNVCSKSSLLIVLTELSEL